MSLFLNWILKGKSIFNTLSSVYCLFLIFSLPKSLSLYSFNINNNINNIHLLSID